MSGWAAWAVFGLATAGVTYLTALEARHYIRRTREPSEVDPCSRRRLILRTTTSVCLLVEVALLVFAKSWFARQLSGFLTYVSVVVGIAALMAVLAYLDLKESRRLQKMSENKLLEEFLSGLGPDWKKGLP